MLGQRLLSGGASLKIVLKSYFFRVLLDMLVLLEYRLQWTLVFGY